MIKSLPLLFVAYLIYSRRKSSLGNLSKYRPFPEDFNPDGSRKKTKLSKYTKKYHDMFGGNEPQSRIKGLVNKSEDTGIPYNILKEVYDRGMEAWVTSHRPGANQHQWAYARVNSFITGGKTQKTTDSDLWEMVDKSRLTY